MRTSPRLPEDFWDLLEGLVEIGSPTHQEAARVAFIETWLHTHVPYPVHHNEAGCLVIDLRNDAQRSEPATLVDAHVDTVFPDTRIHIRKEQEVWHAPGISDNTGSVALLMTLIRELHRTAHHAPLLVSFTTGEESHGNLRGIRQVIADWKTQISGVLALDLDLSQFSICGPGSSRHSFKLQGKGGHSWKDFGSPNPLFLFTDWLVELRQRFTWEKSQDTLNIQLETDRSGVSCIPSQLCGDLEIRSMQQVHIEERTQWVQESLNQLARQHDLDLSLEFHGSRPAGSSDKQSYLFQALQATHAELGLPMQEVVASTNINLPASLGIPAVCTGHYVRGGVHTRAELLHTPTVHTGWDKLWRMVNRLIHHN